MPPPRDDVEDAQRRPRTHAPSLANGSGPNKKKKGGQPIGRPPFYLATRVYG